MSFPVDVRRKLNHPASGYNSFFPELSINANSHASFTTSMNFHARVQSGPFKREHLNTYVRYLWSYEKPFRSTKLHGWKAHV